jgi:hypothetical protein
MKKLVTVFFACAMAFSIVVVGNAAPAADAFAVVPQTGQVTVRRRKPGIARRTYRGGRYVVRRTWDGTKWVSKKVWVGTKWTGKKTWKTGRKVVSRTKKVVY